MSVQSLLSRKADVRRDIVRHPGLLQHGLSHLRVIVMVSTLLLVLSSCALAPTPSKGANGNDVTIGSGSPTASSSPTLQATQAPITLQVTGCPTLSINWDQLAGTKTGVNKVQKVMCGSLEYGGLAALVNVRYYSSDNRLDFLVYDNLYGTPAKRFSVSDLIDGDAKISPTNTIITAENPARDPLGPNVFKEYQWNGSSFGQILFPGLYPDVTHYQAEQSQATVNAQIAQASGTPTASTPWQASAFPVVSKFASDVFHWSSVQPSTVTYNDRFATYIVKLTNMGPGGGGFIATLFRLDNVVTNIFEIRQITSIDGTMSLSSPAPNTTVSSPVHMNASYQSTGTILGRGVVYSDTFQIYGDTGAIHGSASTGAVGFAPTVNYQQSSKGLQEGIVAFFVTNQNNIAVSNQVLAVKVFLSA